MEDQKEIHGWNARQLADRAAELAVRTGASTILLEGPPGCGKELLATHIAARLQAESDGGENRGDPLKWRYNLACVTETVATSQLFGHKKGSFTGAYKDQNGQFDELAAGDVFFLDEIGLAPEKVHAQLLRIVEYGDYYRVGETKRRQVGGGPDTTTLIAALGRGKIPNDLRDRFELQFSLPPLTDRLTDIPPLVATFVREYNEQPDAGFKAVHPSYITWIATRALGANLREKEEQDDQQREVRWLRRTVLQECTECEMWYENLPPKERRILEQFFGGRVLFSQLSLPCLVGRPANQAVSYPRDTLLIDAHRDYWIARSGRAWGPTKELLTESKDRPGDLTRYPPWDDANPFTKEGPPPSPLGGTPKTAELLLTLPVPRVTEDPPLQIDQAKLDISPQRNLPEESLFHSSVSKREVENAVPLEDLFNWDTGEFFYKYTDGDWSDPTETDSKIMAAIVQGAIDAEPTLRALACISRSGVASPERSGGPVLPTWDELKNDVLKMYTTLLAATGQTITEQADITGKSKSWLKGKRKIYGLSNSQSK